jgi:hypothetical protein
MFDLDNIFCLNFLVKHLRFCSPRDFSPFLLNGTWLRLSFCFHFIESPFFLRKFSSKNLSKSFFFFCHPFCSWKDQNFNLNLFIQKGDFNKWIIFFSWKYFVKKIIVRVQSKNFKTIFLTKHCDVTMLRLVLHWICFSCLG